MHNRESWLQSAANEMEGMFTTSGFPLPPKVKVSVGWPSKSALSRKNRRIGECWDATSTTDGVAQIFISPTIADPMKALGVLAHELVHAAVGCACAHKGDFIKCAKAIGLTPKWTSTGESPELVKELAIISEVLGAFPHAEINPIVKEKAQTTRLLKVSCETDNYIVRVTRKVIDLHGCPICPVCNEVMEEAGNE